MEACTFEEQMRFWIYNLETACKMADDAGTITSCTIHLPLGATCCGDKSVLAMQC
jgi:hypothetical protein